MERVVASDEVSSNPFVSAETQKACALIGLHLLAAEGEAGSSGSQSPIVSPEWSSSRSATETCLVVRSMSTTTSAGQLKSLGRISQARW